MTAPPLAARRDVRRALGLGAAGALAAVAMAAALLITGSPVYVVAGAIGIGVAVLIVFSPEWAVPVMAVVTAIRLPAVATDFHGVPSIFQPLVALIAFAVLLRWLATGVRPHGGMRAGLTIGAYVAVASLSILGAVDIGAGMAQAFVLVKDVIVAVLVGMLLHQARDLRRTVWAFTLAGGALGALTAFQFLTDTFWNNYFGFAQAEVQNILGREINDFRISGPYEDPNFYGQILIMLLPFAIDRFRAESSRLARLAAAGSALVMVLSIVFTFSRGAALGLVVVGGYLVWKHPPKPALVGAAVVGLVLAVPLAPPAYVDRLLTLGQIGEIAGGTDVSIRGRTAEIKAGVAMFVDRPLTGVGLANYPANYIEYSSEMGIELRREPRDPHNLVLEIAAETGVVGLSAFGMVLMAAWGTLDASRRRFARLGRLREVSICNAIVASMLGYAATSIFLHMEFARLFWFLIGVVFTLPALASRLEEASSDELSTA